MQLRKTHIATLLVGLALVGGAIGALLNRTSSGQTFVQADAPVGTAKLSLDPSQSNLKVGDQVKVNVMVSTGNDATSGVDVVLHYNPNILEVVDADAATPGIQIMPGKLFDFQPANDVTLALGTINFSASQQPVSKPVQVSNGVLATITFQAKSTGSTPLQFDFQSGLLSDSNVIKANDGRDLLNRAVNGTIVVQ